MSGPGCVLGKSLSRKSSLIFLSAIPQFGCYLTLAPPDCPQGFQAWSCTLSIQSVPPRPAPAHWWQLPASGLLLHWEWWLGAYSVGFLFLFLFLFFPGYVAFWDSQTPHRPANERNSFSLETSCFTTPSPRQVSLPNTFVSLFIFYISSCLLLKRMGCLSGCLMSSTSVQRLFCRSCSAFKWSFDEFVGRKWSPHPNLPPFGDHPQ